MWLYNDYVDHFGIAKDHELTPNKVWADLYKHMDFIKNKIADPFPPDDLWSRFFHHCGFTRHLSPQDIFINAPWGDE